MRMNNPQGGNSQGGNGNGNNPMPNDSSSQSRSVIPDTPHVNPRRKFTFQALDNLKNQLTNGNNAKIDERRLQNSKNAVVTLGDIGISKRGPSLANNPAHYIGMENYPDLRDFYHLDTDAFRNGRQITFTQTKVN